MQGETAQLETWWSHFQDPVLDQLIQDSLAQNFSLREAGERILEARARRDIAAGNLYPQAQSLNGAYGKSRASTNTANFFSFPGVFSPNINPESWTINAAAAWELDFWGRYRRAVEAADASLNATCAAYDEARVLMLAEVAQSYIEVRTLEYRIYLAQKNLDIQKRTLELASKKKEAGLANGLDVAQAQSNVGQTAAAIPTLEIARRQANNALCVLLGRPPTDLHTQLGVTAQIPKPPYNLAFGIPADLLRRRPDVRRAEHVLAGQSAKIGIAESEFYPHISLTGNIGFAAQDFGQAFNSNSHTALISPGFTWNLLNYGRIKNNIKAEQAAFRASCFTYQNSVLRAAKEAEDAQVAYLLGFDRADALNQAVDGAKDAVQKSEALYKSGSIDFGRVYVLQAELLLQQDELAVAEGQISQSLVQLFKALGGGWGSPHFTNNHSTEVISSSYVTAAPISQLHSNSPPIDLHLNANWANVPFLPSTPNDSHSRSGH